MNSYRTFMASVAQISLICVLAITNMQAQESGAAIPVTQTNETIVGPEIHPLRIGIEAGAPSILNLNVEYVTPLLDNRIGFYVDYLPFKFGIDDVKIKMNNFEIGSNIYLGNKGKGVYVSIGYFDYSGEAEVPDVDFDDGSFGTGETSIDFSTTNVKLGGRFGDRFYARFEVGFGFGDIPEELVITSIDGSGSTIEPIEDIVSLFGSSGIPLLSIGFGYSLL